MGGKGEELNRGRGSVVDSNLLCLEYDGRADQAVHETDSWERDHSCNARNVGAYGKYLGEVDTIDIDGIQGRHIAEYSEQRQPKVGMLLNCYMWGGVERHRYGMILWIFSEPEKVNARWCFQF